MDETLALLDDSFEAWRRHRDRLFWRWLEPRCGEGPGRVLKTDLYDEAVSVGFLEALRGAGWSEVGLDLSPLVARSAARRSGCTRCLVTTVLDLPIRDGGVDLILSLSTLDHFESLSELERALAELRRVLPAGGRLLLTLDNLDNPLVRLRNALPARLLRSVGLVPYQVGLTLGRRELITAAHRAGFEIESAGWVLHCPRAVMVALCRLSRRYLGGRGDRVLGAAIRWFEALARLPTRRWTGYYTAVEAVARHEPSGRRRPSGGEGPPGGGGRIGRRPAADGS